MKTKIIVLAALLAGGGAGRAVAGSSAANPTPRVSVTFVNPQNFTDLKRDIWGGGSDELVGEFRTFILQTGKRYIPAGMHLDVKVTDIDLAGDFEPWRGAQFNDVRIVRDIYIPRIKLQFTLTDSQGKVVNSGERDLSDPGFEQRLTWPPGDYLRYEKDMLRDWFSQEFGGLKAG